MTTSESVGLCLVAICELLQAEPDKDCRQAVAQRAIEDIANQSGIRVDCRVPTNGEGSRVAPNRAAGARVRLARRSPKLNEEGMAFATLRRSISIEALREFVQGSEIIKLSEHAVLLQGLAEIERDIEHFRRHRSFRRREWLPR